MSAQTAQTALAAPGLVAALVVAAVLITPRPARRAARSESRRRAVAPAVGRDGMPPHADDDLAAPAAGEIASALVLLALGYRSGLPTWEVLRAVADQTSEPVSRDLRQVAAALQWGASEAEAWASVDAGWSPAGRAVAIAHQAGVPPGPLLLRAADDLNILELERVELAAARVGVRLVAPLGLVLLPAFCLTTVVPLVLGLARGLLTGR